MRRFLLYLISLVILAGCRDEEKGPTPIKEMNIVTVKSVSPGVLVREGDASETGQTLISDIRLPESLREGMRVMAYYSLSTEDKNRNPLPVEIEGIGIIPFDTLRFVAPDILKNYNYAGISVSGQWKEGDFFNLRLGIVYNGSPVDLRLVTDGEKDSSGRLKCFVANMKTPVANGVIRESYASFYLGKYAENEIIVVDNE